MFCEKMQERNHITTSASLKKIYGIYFRLRQEVNDRQNLELVRCARALGMHPMYMGHFTRMFCEKIREGPSRRFMVSTSA